MEALHIRVGPLLFDHAYYAADGDVLYLHVGLPQPAEGEELPKGTCFSSCWAHSASSG